MKIPGILRIFKKFLFSRANKEFVVFIFFLALSGIFWLFTTLNEVYEYEFEIPVSVVGVLIFVGLTAYDSQKIKRMLMMQADMGETAQKVALMGALSLYLDFINLFLYLLRLFGRER